MTTQRKELDDLMKDSVKAIYAGTLNVLNAKRDLTKTIDVHKLHINPTIEKEGGTVEYITAINIIEAACAKAIRDANAEFNQENKNWLRNTALQPGIFVP